jgi:antitoxin component of RelBE/YafQ-DinJ toxin-antitoxin module
MIDVHITVDEQLLAEAERAGEPLGLDQSQVISQALQSWLHRHTVARFEQEWIAALQQHPDEAERAEAWLNVVDGEER